MTKKMQARILLGAAFGICAAVILYGGIPAAKEPACRYLKIQSDNVNVSKKPRGASTYIDVLDTGDIVCVTRNQKTDGRDWAFIAHKLVKPAGQRKPVDGWANPKLMQPASPAELAAAQGTPVPAPAARGDTGRAVEKPLCALPHLDKGNLVRTGRAVRQRARPRLPQSAPLWGADEGDVARMGQARLPVIIIQFAGLGSAGPD